MRAVVAIASVMLVSYAYAEPGGPRPDLVRALCHKDGCDEFRITANTVVREIPDGTLRKVAVETFKANSAGRTSKGTETSYTYCSKQHPALIAVRPGKTVALLIGPYNPDPPETIRKAANFTAIYFTACHGPEQGRASIANRAATAEALQYPRLPSPVRTMELTGPEEIIRLYEPKPVAGVTLPKGPAPRVESRAEPSTEPDEDQDERRFFRPPGRIPLPLIDD